MYADAGEKLLYLPPYSPDLNPIEEFFAELKGFIKRSWSFYKESPDQGFDTFLRWYVDTVGAKEESASGHFRLIMNLPVTLPNCLRDSRTLS